MSKFLCKKVRHKTFNNAVIAVKRVGNAGLSVYKCRCGSFHLGTSRGNNKVQARIDQLLGLRK